MLESVALFRALGDDARLRLLRLVMAERLNVSELTSILGIAQSGVSRHLGILREAGLVREKREGGFTYYGVAPNGKDQRWPDLWPILRERLAGDRSDGTPDGVLRDDDARLREVMRQRREHRETHGRSPDTDRQLVPGRSWAAWSRALGLLLPDLVVADLGCGDGHLTLEMAGWASRVIGVDQSRDVLARARALARRQGIKNIEWKRGEIEDLPLAEASVDLAVLSQSLHHAVDPPTALGEAFRVVRTGGRVLVLELEAHDQTWVTDRLGDRWLGFTPAGLTRLMQDVGWQDIDVRSGLEGSPFGVVVAAGHKPATSRGRARRQQRSKHTR